jgi:NaMN:DMB phosphoribosyltransferase
MRNILVVCAALALSGCGLGETTTAAATGASLKAQEAKQAERTQEQVQQKLEDANLKMQQRADIDAFGQ